MLTPYKGRSRAITSVEKHADGLYLYSEAGMLRIVPQTPRAVRITYTEKKEFERGIKPGIVYHDREVVYRDTDAAVKNDVAMYCASYSDNADNSQISKNNGKADGMASWNVTETEDRVIVTTSELKIVADKRTASLTYSDAAGRLLLCENKKKSRELEEFPVYRLDKNEAVKKEKIETADGVKEVINSAGRVCVGTLYHTKLNLEWQTGEMIFGLGQHEEGYHNLRGRTVYVHQANRKIAVPLLVSSIGYGILVDTYAPMIFNDNEAGSYIYTEADKELDYYFIRGGGMDGVVKEYRMLTGKAAMLPKWAFGYIQSQERYETQAEILDVAGEYRKRGLGLDAIVLDWCSWEDGMWGQKSFDGKRFPNPSEMTDRLHRDGIHFMMSIWPNMSEQCENYKEFAERDLLLNGNSIYNALSKEARELYWKQLEEALYVHGVDAWWCDSSEPYTPEWNHIVRPEAACLYSEYVRSLGDYMPLEMSDAYCLFHAQAVYEGQRGSKLVQYADKRVINLTRSGYTGQQRYGTILWSGDIAATWETLRRQIAAGLNFCASGLPYWTVDIGAFFVKSGLQWYWKGDYEAATEDPCYRELYVRWYEWACFLPVFRGHGTDCRRELWAFGDEGEPFYDALVKYNRLRYALMPYIYSQAGKVWLCDDSMIKMLAFAFPDDAEAVGISDQYMFGESIMACPVTVPMYYNAKSMPIYGDCGNVSGNRGSGKGSFDVDAAIDAAFGQTRKARKVYLPAGTGWYDYWTNTHYEGGQWIEADAPLDIIPLFVREGSIIPFEEEYLTDARGSGKITLRIYAGRDCEYTLYEDSGDGYGYENGEYALTRFNWDDKSGELTTTVIKDCPDKVKRAEIEKTVVIDR